MLPVLRRLGLITLLLVVFFFLNCSDDKITDDNFPQPPRVPSNPLPVDGATGIDTSLTLSWQCSDANGDSLTYDIYFDTLSEPVIIDSNITAATYTTASLEVSRDYYWKIVARDDGGLETASPVWHFSTVPGIGPIVFSSIRNGARVICTMNSDGSDVRIVSDTLTDGDYCPSVSNYGDKIVFSRGASQIYTINRDGTGLFPVTQYLEGGPSLPVWSPDDCLIAFVVRDHGENPYSSIWVVGSTGENPHEVAGPFLPNYEDTKISWSPAGNGFVFEYDSLGLRSCAIYAINSDGTNMRAITDHSNYDVDPAWSHDGTRIAFVRRLENPEDSKYS